MFRVCFEEFGGDVKFWITLNEPKETSLQGHGSGTMAPGLKGPGTLVYEAAHNQIRLENATWRNQSILGSIGVFGTLVFEAAHMERGRCSLGLYGTT